MSHLGNPGACPSLISGNGPPDCFAHCWQAGALLVGLSAPRSVGPAASLNVVPCSTFVAVVTALGDNADLVESLTDISGKDPNDGGDQDSQFQYPKME